MRNFVVGVVLTLVVFFGGGYLFLRMGLMPVNADARPGRLEMHLANVGLDAAVARAAGNEPNPVTTTDDNLRRGLAVYQASCQGCHGGAEADGKMGLSMYPDAPQFRNFSPDDPDARLFWVVKHGIRLTGMLAFGGAANTLLKDQEIWEAVLFIKNTRSLPPAVLAEWKKAGAGRGK
jgi:mono/diheme cytochrome c family protein